MMTGCAATFFLIVSMPLYLLRTSASSEHRPIPTALESLGFTGSRKCAECHRTIYQRWEGSHHYHAMAEATAGNVLGDFNDVTFDYFGFANRFYKKGDRFFVFTKGVDGVAGEFEITHTFGWYPLQQYLIPFPGGRLQCLPIAWNVRERRWFHLYPDTPFDPGDWYYWTNGAQNWNGMCAECHSTNLAKNYRPEDDTFETSWSEINVGCEACHGPGSAHVAWAELPDMARLEVENHNLRVNTSELSSRKLVEICAACHSRRASMGDYTHDEADLLDSFLPSSLEPNLYYPDGQILDEVYEYGSFTQSKMYHRDVRCSDCHDVHSGKTVKKGNQLCLQCHRAAEYDTPDHHFHKSVGDTGEPIRSEDGKVLFEVGAGAECVGCHMPGRTYMGIDYRLDHSLRRPRPDLTMTIAVPNGCNRCHLDKSAKWADDTITRWYGPGRTDHYGTTLAHAINQDPESLAALIALVESPLYPVIVRATALSRLNAFPGPDTDRMIRNALSDSEALMRHTAIMVLPESPSPDTLARLLVPLLYDSVKAVRIEAARRLAGPASGFLTEDQQVDFQAALKGYERAMRHAADFAYARFNLGNLNVSLGNTDEAIRQYKWAIKIDSGFYPAKINLASLYNRLHNKGEAEGLFREIFKNHPTVYTAAYSLGLLLAEKKEFEDAIYYLEKAAVGMPKNARARYNLGLLFQLIGKNAKAEESFKIALNLEPANRDLLYALAEHYYRRGLLKKAEEITRTLVEAFPEDTHGHNLLSAIDQARERF